MSRVDCKHLVLPLSMSNGVDSLLAQQTRFGRPTPIFSIHFEQLSYGTLQGFYGLLHFCSQHGEGIFSWHRNHAHISCYSSHGSCKKDNQFGDFGLLFLYNLSLLLVKLLLSLPKYVFFLIIELESTSVASENSLNCSAGPNFLLEIPLDS